MALPYIKFYPGDYLRDTRHFTAEQHGAYLLLLMVQWQDGSLPTKPAVLARMAGIDPERWRYVGKDVMEKFDIIDGRYVQKRMAADRAQAGEKSLKLAANGRAGGLSKSLKTKKPDVANAKQMLKQTGVGVITESDSCTESDKESPNRCSLDHEFAQIMTLYPRPTHRREGRMAYHQARTEGASFREIVAGIDRLKANLPSDPQFIPSLPKWLLGERWKDEPLPPPQARETPYQAAIRKAKADINEAAYGKRDDPEFSNVIDLQAHSSA